MKTLQVISVALTCILAVMSCNFATALEAEQPIQDPEQRALYEQLNQEVRCLVCQNQTIGDSNAPLAADLRREIRALVEAGQTEQEIKLFLTERYGDFVLYKPRYDGPAALLWAAPGLLLLIGLYAIAKIIRRRTQMPYSDEEQP